MSDVEENCFTLGSGKTLLEARQQPAKRTNANGVLTWMHWFGLFLCRTLVASVPRACVRVE